MDQKNGESISVFVSYRRKDSPGHAGRIRDALRGRFGDDRVFYDVATIEGGVDFAVAIRNAIEKTSVVVVIVGPLWGQRRIWDRVVGAPDWVRFEIEYARQLAKPILPIVVAGAAAMPTSRSLHPNIRFISTIQVVSLRDDSWDSDVKRLLDRLPVVSATPATLVPALATPPPRRARRYGALAAAIVLGVLALWLARFAGPSRGPTPDRPTNTAPVPDAVTLTPQTAETPGITAPPPAAAPSPKGLGYGVRVTNRPPTTGTIDVQPDDEGLVSATRFLFTARGVTDPDGDALTYTWDFGDGTSSAKSSPSVTKVYDRVSRFDVRLLTSDGKVVDSIVAAETQVTVRDVTGTWNLTIGRDPAARVLLPTKYAVTLIQQGNTLTGRIVPDGGSRSTVLTGYVEHPNRVYFGSEHAWWNDDEDAYFDLEMGAIGIQMRNRNDKRCGPQLPCTGALANKQ